MSLVLQEILVGLLVAGCVLYSAWRLGSLRMRLAALDALGAVPGLRTAAWLAALRGRTQEGLGGGCGGCAKGTAGPKPQARVSELDR